MMFLIFLVIYCISQQGATACGVFYAKALGGSAVEFQRNFRKT